MSNKQDKINNIAISISAGSTIDIIYKTRIHAHPNDNNRYPYTNEKYLYYTFREKKGIMRKVFSAKQIIILNPFNKEAIKYLDVDDDVKIRLNQYIIERENLSERKKRFVYPEDNIDYKFYVLDKEINLPNIVRKPNVQGYTFFEIYDLFNGDDVIPTINERVEEEKVYREGRVSQANINKYERNENAREECLRYYGYTCIICGFNFERFYGRFAYKIIEVHHKRPLYTIKSDYNVNPKVDLVPVCPNCHRVIHHRTPPYEIEELKQLINR